MRSLLLAFLVAAPLMAAPRSAVEPISRGDRWAFGVMLGDPTGLTLKRYLGRNAFDAYLGFWAPGLRLGADFLWNLGRLVRSPKVDMDLYVGAGAFGGALSGPCGPGFITCGNGEGYVGGRVPFGAELILKEAPVTFGAEIAPASRRAISARDSSSTSCSSSASCCRPR